MWSRCKCQSDKVVYVEQFSFVLYFLAVSLFLYFMCFFFISLFLANDFIAHVRYLYKTMMARTPRVLISLGMANLVDFGSRSHIEFMSREQCSIEFEIRNSIGFFLWPLTSSETSSESNKKFIWAMTQRPWTIFTHRLIDENRIVFRHDAPTMHEARSHFNTSYQSTTLQYISTNIRIESNGMDEEGKRKRDGDNKMIRRLQNIVREQKKMWIHWSEQSANMYFFLQILVAECR